MDGKIRDLRTKIVDPCVQVIFTVVIQIIRGRHPIVGESQLIITFKEDTLVTLLKEVETLVLL
jgi:hypothetical protein